LKVRTLSNNFFIKIINIIIAPEKNVEYENNKNTIDNNDKMKNKYEEKTLYKNLKTENSHFNEKSLLEKSISRKSDQIHKSELVKINKLYDENKLQSPSPQEHQENKIPKNKNNDETNNITNTINNPSQTQNEVSNKIPPQNNSCSINIGETHIHAVTDNEITDDTLVYFYKRSPIFIDFLHFNNSLSPEKYSYFEKIKKNFTLKKCKFSYLNFRGIVERKRKNVLFEQ